MAAGTSGKGLGDDLQYKSGGFQIYKNIARAYFYYKITHFHLKFKFNQVSCISSGNMALKGTSGMGPGLPTHSGSSGLGTGLDVTIR